MKNKDITHITVARARKMRKEQTPEEGKLWHLYLKKLKPRFIRQKIIGPYIVDFYCHKAKLIIEIDGSQHFTEDGMRKDNFRTEILEGYDLKVIRFTNQQINTNFRGVCEYIDWVVKASL